MWCLPWPVGDCWTKVQHATSWRRDGGERWPGGGQNPTEVEQCGLAALRVQVMAWVGGEQVTVDIDHGGYGSGSRPWPLPGWLS
jgi:hypothetical protein